MELYVIITGVGFSEKENIQGIYASFEDAEQQVISRFSHGGFINDPLQESDIPRGIQLRRIDERGDDYVYIRKMMLNEYYD